MRSDPPTTTLDTRFSDAGASATDWPTTLAVIESAGVMWISTVRADGRPHVTPLVVVWHDGAAYFCTGAGEQKAANLREHPDVALTTGHHGWRDGLDVVIEGRAALVRDRALLQVLATRWTEKWDGRWQFEDDVDGFLHEEGGSALVFEVVPTKVLAFAKGDAFAHTTHRF